MFVEPLAVTRSLKLADDQSQMSSHNLRQQACLEKLAVHVHLASRDVMTFVRMSRGGEIGSRKSKKQETVFMRVGTRSR